jgi:hypothetical protein
MVVTRIAHKPELTAEDVREIFRRHFDAWYTIETFKGPAAKSRDFMVVKNPFVAVTVKLEQSVDGTKLVYNGFSPRWWARGLVYSVWNFFLWNGLTDEVRQFIERAPEFEAPPRQLRPWWLSLWWLSVEATECVLALLLGALMIDFPAPPGWWLALGIALVVLGPANIGLTILLGLRRLNDHAQARWTRLGLVAMKIIVSVVLVPLLIFCGLLIALLCVVAWSIAKGSTR